MADDGWIKLHRKVQDWKFWRREKFTWGQAWIDMLLMANHKKRSFSVRGNTMTINPGQIGHSEDTLADKWLWSRGKVRRFLRTLEMEQQIVQQKSFILNVITVLNWDSYQLNDTADGTAERQQTDTNKNDKNEKNKYILSKFEEIWSEYPHKDGRKEALRHYQASVKSEEDVNRLKVALENYKASVISRRKNGHPDLQWKNGSTWFNNWIDWLEIKHEPAKRERLPEW